MLFNLTRTKINQISGVVATSGVLSPQRNAVITFKTLVIAVYLPAHCVRNCTWSGCTHGRVAVNS